MKFDIDSDEYEEEYEEDFEGDYEEKPKKSSKSKKRQEIEQKKLYLIIALLIVLALIIVFITYVALKKGNPTQPAAPVTSPTTTKKEQKSITVVNQNSNDRPIAVMIDNAIGDARHAGLQDSYLNYEIIVEGGLTRIMAIYKDADATLIGPIRSARHYFLDYALESDAIYAHYGWSPYAEDDITKLAIDNIDGLTMPEAYRRDNNSIAPHNVFTKMKYLKSYLEKTNYEKTSSNWELLSYSADPVDLNDTNYVPKQAIKVNIPYSTNEYRTYAYDPSNEYYLRSNNGKAQLDRITGNQLHYKNIIIQRVPNRTLDSEGRQEVETTGSGKGYYITNGFFLPIKWSKESRESKTYYTYDDGTEIMVNDGNTFIQIVPVDSNITIE